ncbi:hypothetical protein A5787_16175 [Mycobacterium sp. 852002-50816_SCH5313054-b]|uniref:hypothetical protein n=1 Tax=Mycobacterium sp. 852002-50816_SCH5313054-b TaxID=1834092 RepID=UPI00080231E4|nr:hypothetical protein [Mycobacterium sp. 852002-50816_SCH5313054-b]OBF62782.1 hypothetical protein A5787_16175 [Mycobacterium sp. 852002-50816_SCH5313054-b]
MADDEDTGTQSWVPDFDDEDDTGSQPAPEEPERPAKPEAPAAAETAEDEAGGVPVQPVTVPGRYLYLKWWQLVLVLFGVWMVSAVVGLGLFYWWYHSIDKTDTTFAVLVYVVACVVGGVMLAMAQGRALLSALALAVMSGPFASVAAAAPLYGYYFCERTGHCLIGVIPY